MKRLVTVIFVIVAAALGILFFMGDSKDTGAASVTRSQTVIPKSATQQQDTPEIQAQDEVDDSLVSLIPLRNDEILMGILGIDFDGDGYDDQINTIRSMTSPYIKIIVGLYNPYKGQYERSAIIDTEIIQTRTFSYTCMDIIGNHRNVLSYSGFLEDGNSVMKLFLPEKRDTGLMMNVIGDFRSDGTIFIQQMDRHESYLSQKANGVSYPVWVYRSDNSQGENSLDQIQTRYIWNIASGKYVKDTETKVRETKVSTRELNKILDGTVASFKKHLDGLWFSSDTQQFIFFNPREEEIIFQTGDTQEVYTWVSSTLRRNGIYITAINSSINNLTRRIDISLSSSDEIQVRNQDDVLMTISEKSLWDGKYKKQGTAVATKSNATAPNQQEILHLLEGQKHWLVEGVTEMEIAGGTYTSSLVTGMITSSICDGQEVIQMRGSVGAPFYNQESYLATVEHNQDTKLLESVRLAPVKITPLGVQQLGGSPIRLQANYNVVENEVAHITTPDEPELKAVSTPAEDDLPRPVLSVHTSPRYFSPDNDGIDDNLTIDLAATSEIGLASWSFNIYDPENGSLIWSRSGVGEVSRSLTWNGRSNAGELVQSATDYPFTFSAKDTNGLSSEARGELSVDVLVIHEGEVLKIQVPSIIFRSDKADFVGKSEDPKKGLDQATIDNNIKVIQRIAQILNKFPDYSVRIEGHANNITGTEAEETSTDNGNIPLVPLSEERAKLVRDMLVSFGVKGDRLSTVGMGGRQPVVSRADKANWWKNRRVEFILDK